MKQIYFYCTIGAIGLASTNISLANQADAESAHSAYLNRTDKVDATKVDATLEKKAPTSTISSAVLDTLSHCVVVLEDNSVTDCNEEQAQLAHVALNENSFEKDASLAASFSSDNKDLNYESSNSAVLDTLSHCVVVTEDNSVFDCRTMQIYSSTIQQISRKLENSLYGDKFRAYVQGGVGVLLMVSAGTLFTTMTPAFIIIGAITIVFGSYMLFSPTLSSAKRAYNTSETLNLIKNGEYNDLRAVLKALVNEGHLNVSTEKLLNILVEY